MTVMPGKLTPPPLRSRTLAGAALLGSVALSSPASAQTQPNQAPPAAGAPGPAVNPICPRLEVQLATIDRGGSDPAKDEQIRRYQDAAAKQQAELDRVR